MNLSYLSALSLCALFLTLWGCASSNAQGPINADNDAFAAWGQPPMGAGGGDVRVVEAGADTHTQEAIAAQEAWLRSRADWRSFDAERLEGEILRLSSARRVEAGEEPLAYSPRLANIARGHSLDLSLAQALTHETPGRPEIGLSERLTLSGLNVKAGAENLGRHPLVRRQWDDGRQDLYTWGAVAAGVVRGWMESPPHRENLLNGGLREAGIGAALGEGEFGSDVYVTQDLIRQR